MTAIDDGLFEAQRRLRRRRALSLPRLAATWRCPIPASRAQAGDVHGPSIVVDPHAYAWRHPDWRGRPWHER